MKPLMNRQQIGGGGPRRRLPRQYPTNHEMMRHIPKGDPHKPRGGGVGRGASKGNGEEGLEAILRPISQCTSLNPRGGRGGSLISCAPPPGVGLWGSARTQEDG